MFEAILNKNLPAKRIQATAQSVLIASAVMLLVLMVLLIWQIPLTASLSGEPVVAERQIITCLVETVIVLSVMVPLLVYGKRVLETWIQSQSFVQTLFQDSVEPILLYQFDGHITSCNPAFSKMLGYQLEEIKQMSFQDLIVSDGQELAYLFRTGDSGIHAQATLALQTSDQQVIFAIAHEQRIQIRGKLQSLTFLEDITASHIENQKNKILGEITSTLLETQDIRQVYRTVCAEIVKSADSLVVLLGTFNPKMADLDILTVDGSPQLLEHFHNWNAQALPNGLLGIPLTQENITWLTEPTLTPYNDLQDESLAVLLEQVDSTHKDGFPLLLIPPDNMPPAQILARRLYMEEDQVTSIMTFDYKGQLDMPFVEQMLYFFSTAISRLATQEQLNQSQLQLSETQQLVKVGRLQYDFQTGRTVLSKELCILCGMPEHTTAMELIRLIHPDDQPAFAQIMDRIIQYPTHSQLRFNFRMFHANGHTLYLRSQSKIHFDDIGKPLYVVTAIHDATELMSTRDLLQQRQVDLDTLVKERQTMEEQVSVQFSELESVNKNLNTALMVKDEFLASMSSNLKAPLTAILGATELLTGEKKGVLTADQFRYVSLIERSGQQLLNTINTILDLTRFSLNKEEISQEKVGLNDLCQSSVLYAQSFSNSKQVSLQYELKIQRPYIIGDPIRLRQILTILLRQAINSAPEKGMVRLEIFSHTDTQFVQFEISDNGKIAASNLYEIHSEESMELEIATRLVELHGGTIKVNYQKGSGNLVSVLLPRYGILDNREMPTLPSDEDFVSPAEAAERG